MRVAVELVGSFIVTMAPWVQDDQKPRRPTQPPPTRIHPPAHPAAHPPTSPPTRDVVIDCMPQGVQPMSFENLLHAASRNKFAKVMGCTPYAIPATSCRELREGVRTWTCHTQHDCINTNQLAQTNCVNGICGGTIIPYVAHTRGCVGPLRKHRCEFMRTTKAQS